MTKFHLSRRKVLGGLSAGATMLAAPALAQDANLSEPVPDEFTRRNLSGFRAHRWQDYFGNLRNGAILVDTKSRALHYWSEDQSVFKVYPTSVPLTEEMTRRGVTRVTKKVVGPSWAPTPSMKRRNPEWPDFVPPGPDTPLGTHAMHLSWRYYRIHGTHDTRKIGRQSSNGCIGLYNEDIVELFDLSNVGTPVRLI